MDWFDALKIMKRESGMTTLEISKKSGVPEPTLEKLFSGFTKDPKLSTVADVVHCFGHTLDDLTLVAENEEQLVEKETKQNKVLELFKLTEKLNRIAQQKLLDYAEDLNKIEEYKA